MDIRLVLLPLFVQVALTFVLLVWMGMLRREDIRARGVRPAEIALREPNWTPRTTQVANAFANQLELPLLFYVLTILALYTHKADYLFVVMAWAFVILRILHALIHTTNNRVIRRGAVFALAAIVLIVMWVIFAIRILLATG